MYVSAFELYRIGPGPSSSYTVGPQRAALRFVHDLAADGLLPMTARIEAELYGGLAFHGREHGSDKAIVAGLAGHVPERCDGAALALCLSRAETERWLLLDGGRRIRFEPAQDVRLVVERNAMAATCAYNTAVAAVRTPVSRVGLDVLARSVVQSGRAMTTRPKSTSIGGLAVNVVEC